MNHMVNEQNKIASTIIILSIWKLSEINFSELRKSFLQTTNVTCQTAWKNNSHETYSTAVRETSVSRHHVCPTETPFTITALSYWGFWERSLIGPPLFWVCRTTDNSPLSDNGCNYFPRSVACSRLINHCCIIHCNCDCRKRPKYY